MRRRGVRVFALIAVIVGLAIAVLALGEIHIGGFDRVGAGPLGLTLGLDLKGGTHLMYKADLPDEVRVAFGEDVEQSQLQDVLDDLEQPKAIIANREFSISNLALEELAQERLRETLGQLSRVETFNAGDDAVEVIFLNVPNQADLRSVIDQLRYIEATIESADRTLFTISQLPALEEEAEEELRAALEELVPLHAFDVSDDGVLEVIFQSAPDQADLQGVLDQLEYTDATIEGADKTVFTIGNLSLVEKAHEELREVLEDDLAPLDVLNSGDDALDVVLEDAVTETDLGSTLIRMGYDEATIDIPPQRSVTIQGLSLDEGMEEELRRALEEKAAPIEPGSFISNIVDPTPEQMEGVLSTIQRRVNALGTTQPMIQTLGDDQVVIQLPGVGGFSIEVTFRSTDELVAQVVIALSEMGHTGIAVQPSPGNRYAISMDEGLAQEEVDDLESLVGTLAPGATFRVNSENDEDATEIEVAFPSTPNELNIDSLVESLGFSDFTVRQQLGGVFVIRTDNAVSTEDQDKLRDALETQFGEVTTFDIRGGVEEAKSLIGGTAQLVFKERECLGTVEELRAASLSGLPDPCAPVELGGDGRFVDKDIGLTGEDLRSAFPGRDPTTNEPEVNIQFRGRGTGIWSEVTGRLAGDEAKRVVIFLDDEELTAPVVQAHIPDGRTRITGRFTREEVETLAIQLESGRLPVPLALIREGTVDAFLGADSLNKSLIAGIVGLGLVLVFMVVYYRMAGLVAATSLVVYAVILLAILKMVPIVLTLSGIAGLVLSIGMAVDANVLIFERMKEEMRTGRTLTSSMEVGFRRAWIAIRDSNVSTIITCAILFLFGSRLGGGTPVVTSFAVTLLIGVGVSMFTAIMVSRNMLQIMALTPAGRRMALFTPESRRQPASVAGGGK